MLVVHHLGISQSERIVWLCEELEIPYELKVYDRDSITRMAPASYKALHPIGSAPIITDGPVVLPESGAIMEYIIAKHGKGRLALPPSHAGYADYLFWFHFANGTVMPAELGCMLIDRLGGKDDDPNVRTRRAKLDLVHKIVEQRLGEAPYLAGQEFTAADIIMLFPLTTLRAINGRKLGDAPHTKAYLKRIGERPAYQRAMAKGDPGMKPMLE